MKCIEAIFFDAGGILYNIPQKEIPSLVNFLKEKKIDSPSVFEIREKTKELRYNAKIGIISRTSLYEAILDECHVFSDSLRQEGYEVMMKTASNINLLEGVPETLKILKERGFKLGVITNSIIPTNTKKKWLKQRGVDLSWDVFVSSLELGILKPDPEIYLYAIKQVGVLAKHSVFVGHSSDELIGAKNIGMLTLSMHADTDIKTDFNITHFEDLKYVLDY
jgi:HAD superfamily hydrolase (TIGR01549 family)